MLRAVCLALLAWCLIAARCEAQLPTPSRPLGSAQGQYTATLVNSATGPVVSNPIWVGYWTNLSIQVAVTSSSCTSLQIRPEAVISGTTWAPITIDGFRATITQADVPAGQSRLWKLYGDINYLRVNVIAASGCTYSVYALAK